MIRIQLQPAAEIEPGHQFLMVPNIPAGLALVGLLMPLGAIPMTDEDFIYIPHNESVDQEIVALINELAKVRFQSPTLVELVLEVAPVIDTDEDDGGPEDA